MVKGKRTQRRRKCRILVEPPPPPPKKRTAQTKVKRQLRPQKKDKLDMKWNENFQTLTAFEKRHGTCNVPRSNHVLGEWINTQRKHKATGKLSHERLQKLESIGFVWTIQQIDNCNISVKDGNLQRNVQLFSFKADVCRGSKRKPKSVVPFHSSSFEKNRKQCRVGEGFNCPECNNECSYDSKQCFQCSLECYYEAGVGVVALKERVLSLDLKVSSASNLRVSETKNNSSLRTNGSSLTFCSMTHQSLVCHLIYCCRCCLTGCFKSLEFPSSSECPG